VPFFFSIFLEIHRINCTKRTMPFEVPKCNAASDVENWWNCKLNARASQHTLQTLHKQQNSLHTDSDNLMSYGLPVQHVGAKLCPQFRAHGCPSIVACLEWQFYTIKTEMSRLSSKA
jgi:hypothetical protein